MMTGDGVVAVVDPLLMSDQRSWRRDASAIAAAVRHPPASLRRSVSKVLSSRYFVWPSGGHEDAEKELHHGERRTRRSRKRATGVRRVAISVGRDGMVVGRDGNVVGNDGMVVGNDGMVVGTDRLAFGRIGASFRPVGVCVRSDGLACHARGPSSTRAPARFTIGRGACTRDDSIG